MEKPKSPDTGAEKPKVLSQDGRIASELEKRIGNLVQGKQREQVLHQVLTVVQEEIFSGPIPNPRHLQAYEDIVPGAADRIITMAEKSLDAQIDTVTKEVDSEAKDRRLGMHYGFAALVILIAAAVYTAVNGHEVIAGAFVTIGALGTVARFVLGRYRHESPKKMQ